MSSDFLVKCQADFYGALIGDKANSVVFDNSKIKRLVPGFVATVKFDQGIRHSIEYILSHPELQIADEEFDLFCEKIINAEKEAVTYFKSH